jgi:hypothetical protein
LHQQAQVGLQNVAVGDATDTYREFTVNASPDIQSLHILPHQRQAGIGGEVVRQLFDNKVGHVLAHLQGEGHFTPKSLIYMDELDFLTANSRIQVEDKGAHYLFTGKDKQPTLQADIASLHMEASPP